MAAAGAMVIAVTLAACAGIATPSESDGSDSTRSTLEGAITVFAAASLTATFTELADRFEAANPDTSIELNFAGSTDLVTQISEGAPADVFASADEKSMSKLAEAGLVDADAAVDFATNVLAIAVPAGNPAGVETLADLADPAVTTVICAEQVPCGAATAAVERAAGIAIPAVSEESSVTDVLGKVTSGEADAGVVYVTDVIAAGNAVVGIDLDEASEAVNTYPIAPVNDTDSDTDTDTLARAFIDFVMGSTGQSVLGAAGFGRP